MSASPKDYDDAELEEYFGKDTIGYAKTFSISIDTCAISNNEAKNFCKHFSKLKDNDQFIHDIIEYKYNFILITQDNGRSYSVGYDQWNQQNYICKYYNNTRVSDYVIYTVPDGEQDAYMDLEWEKYIK